MSHPAVDDDDACASPRSAENERRHGAEEEGEQGRLRPEEEIGDRGARSPEVEGEDGGGGSGREDGGGDSESAAASRVAGENSGNTPSPPADTEGLRDTAASVESDPGAHGPNTGPAPALSERPQSPSADTTDQKGPESEEPSAKRQENAVTSKANESAGEVARNGVQSADEVLHDKDEVLAQIEAMNKLLMSDAKARHSIRRSPAMDTETYVRQSMERADMFAREVGSEDDVDWDFWGTVIEDYDLVAKKQPKALQANVEKGIPPTLRGMAWQLIAKSRSPSLEADYATLLKANSPHEKSILRDLARTFPKHEHFREKEGEGQTGLYNVVKAYSILDPEVGYCQGLTFLVGPLLLNMPDEEAFCLLVMLLKSPGPYQLRSHYLPSMPGLQLRLYQFDRLLEEMLPNLHKHLTNLGVKSTMYASQWFMTFFAYNFPLPIVLRVFDIVLLEGPSSLIRFALAAVKLSESRLLTMNFEQVMEHVKTGVARMYAGSASRFVSEAMAIQLSHRKMDRLARDHVNEVKRVQARGGDASVILGSQGSGAAAPSSYSATLASYFFPRSSGRAASPSSSQETFDGDAGSPAAAPLSPQDSVDELIALGDAADPALVASAIRRLDADRSRLDAALAKTSEKNVALANDLVGAQLSLAHEQELTEALRRQVLDLKALLAKERQAAEEAVRDKIQALERRATALERRAVEAEGKVSGVEAELVRSKLAFAESEDLRMQLESRWHELRRAVAS